MPEQLQQRPVQSTIVARRSLRRFRPEPVPRETVQRLLESAVQAPNHRRTHPWRFFAVTERGPVRDGLRDLARTAALSRVVVADAAAEARADEKAHEIVDTPVLLFVYAVPGRDPAESQENYAAVCCATQNLLLAAVEEGLGASWSTGGVCTMPDRLAGLLGADPAWTMVGLLYVGVPDEGQLPPPIRRDGPESFTSWLT